MSSYQSFVNVMMRNKSILANYSGSLVCTAPEVTVVEGHWPRNRTLALLHFSSERFARQYLESDPVVRQPDFMGGADFAIVPLKEHPPMDKNFFVIADVSVHDPDTFVNEYSPKTAQMKDSGKVAVTAACPEPVKYKGNWKPNMLIINQWNTATDYHTFYNSDDYQPLKELRQRITHSTVISFNNTLTWEQRR